MTKITASNPRPLLVSTTSTMQVAGDIISPDHEPWDSELGIAYRGKNGPVYYTGNGIETNDDTK